MSENKDYLTEHPGGFWCTLCGRAVPHPGHNFDCPSLKEIDSEKEEVAVEVQEVKSPFSEENPKENKIPDFADEEE